ncbi:MAG: hypothetical protein ACLFU1_08385 [Alphaproteobacteria bacterium]
MAQKKEQKKKPASKKSKSKKKGFSFKTRAWLAFIIAVGIVFLPTSILLLAGMLPSIVAFAVIPRQAMAKVSTITALNLAGCIPFVFKLWASGNDFEASLDIVTNSRYLSVMYLAAAFGYMIDWVVTGIFSSFLYQRGIRRMETIKKRQKKLVEQWGEDVSKKLTTADLSPFDGG